MNLTKNSQIHTFLMKLSEMRPSSCCVFFFPCEKNKDVELVRRVSVSTELFDSPDKLAWRIHRHEDQSWPKCWSDICPFTGTIYDEGSGKMGSFSLFPHSRLPFSVRCRKWIPAIDSGRSFNTLQLFTSDLSRGAHAAKHVVMSRRVALTGSRRCLNAFACKLTLMEFTLLWGGLHF